MDKKAEVLEKLNNEFAQQQQSATNTKQETLLTMLRSAITDQELKRQLQAVLDQPTTKSQLVAAQDFINNLENAANINNEPAAAHQFLLKLAGTDEQLRKDLAAKHLAQKKVDYQNVDNQRHISELFEHIAKTKLLDREIQQRIRDELCEENGDLRPKFIGAKDEVMKNIFSLCETVYTSKKMHAAYSELKWPAFLLWGAIFRLVISKLGEEDPAYLRLLEPDAKPNNNNQVFLKG